MRGVVVVALAALVFGAGLATAAGTSGGTALTVRYWEKGDPAAEPVVWTLRCNPPRGTHPRPAISCRRLAAGGWQLFAPVPKNVVCTEIYGGPQVARVVGLVNGKRVWATFSRQNGCQIARWNRVSPWLLPPGGVT
jgi:Subtilisin inhibitor-like